MFGQTANTQRSGRFRRLASRIGVGILMLGSLTVGTVGLSAQLTAAHPASAPSSTTCGDDDDSGDQRESSRDKGDKGDEGDNDSCVPCDNSDDSGDRRESSSNNDHGDDDEGDDDDSCVPCDNSDDSGDESESSNNVQSESLEHGEHGEHNDDGDDDQGDDDGDDDQGDDGDACPVATHLELNKIVINNSGGTAVQGDFALIATPEGDDMAAVIDGADSDESAEIGIGADVEAGVTYLLSESGPLGYVGSDWVCVGGSQDGDSITLAAGESANCTITNDDIRAPHLVLNKVLINNGGGSAELADFTLTATSEDYGDVISGSDHDASLEVGIGADVMAEVTYALSEEGPAGYLASDWVCEGGSQDGASITLAAGEDANCTITNDDVDESTTTTTQPAESTTTTTQPAESTTTTTQPAESTTTTTQPAESTTTTTQPAGSTTTTTQPAGSTTTTTQPAGSTTTTAGPTTTAASTTTLPAPPTGQGSGGAAPTTAPIRLPVTGGSSGSAVLIAGIGVLLGLAMTLIARRRRSA